MKTSRRFLPLLFALAILLIAAGSNPVNDLKLANDGDANGKKIKNLDSSNLGFGLNVKAPPFSAKGDAHTITDAAINSGSGSLTSASTFFTTDDVGKVMIVRGAGVAGAPLNTTIASVSGGGAANLAANASTTVSGARADFGSLDTAAFNAAVAALPSLGGTIVVPAGNYMLGVTTSGNLWTFARSNVAVRGEGMGVTNFFYSSASANGTLGPGTCLFVGDYSATYNNVSVADLSFIDLNTRTAMGGGHNPSALELYFVNDVHLERIETINAKGNGAINVGGSCAGGVPLISNVYVLDCHIHGDSAGGWNEGDGVNVGCYSNVHFEGNRVIAVGRHAFEGGGVCFDQFFERNQIDMQSRGLSGIAPTGGNRTRVNNNVITNVTSSGYGIDFTADVGAGITVFDNQISGNYVKAANNAIRLQNTSGSGTAVSRLIVSDNYVEAVYGVMIDATIFPDITVANNVFNITGTVLTQAGAPGGPTPITGRLVEIRNNRSTRKMLNFSSTFSNWTTTRQVRIEDNIIGTTAADAQTQEYGGNASTNFGSAYTLAAGALLTSAGISVPGAQVGDDVVVVPDPTWPSEIIFYGRVTAQDTVTVRALNPTAAGVAYPDYTHPVRIYLKRR